VTDVTFKRSCHAAVIAWLLFAGAIGPALAAHLRPSTSPAGADLFAGDWAPRLEIEVDQEGLSVLRANSSNRYNAPNRPAALATIREGTNTYRQVAIHLKGSAGSFRELNDKPGFTLHFNSHIPSQRFHGLEKISLNNSVQDATYVCEVLGRQVFNATSVPAPRAGHAVVILNGEPLGLYVLLEGWNKQFLKRHFADTTGNLYEGAFRDDITAALEAKSGTDPKNRYDLDALIAAAREPDLERRFTAMERVLDVERFAKFVALEVMLNHWDGYSLHVNNYRIFSDKSSGKLIFMPHGMDQLFGVRRRQFDAQVLPAPSGLAARAFMETRAGRRLYLDRMLQLQTNTFDVAALTDTVNKLTRLLRPALQSDPGALAEFNATVPVLRQRVAERHAEIGEQLAGMKTPQFDASGQASLAALDFRRPAREVFDRRRGRFGQEFGRQDTVQTFVPLRAVVLLEAGQYRFQARVRTRLDDRVLDTTGVRLRSSEGESLRREAAGKDWMVLEHDFTLKERAYVDLIYQLGSADDVNAFDKSSLKLTRSTNPRSFLRKSQ